MESILATLRALRPVQLCLLGPHRAARLLPASARPENIVQFFRDVCGDARIIPAVLARHTSSYRRWLESFTEQRWIPLLTAPKGVYKEEVVAPYLLRTDRTDLTEAEVWKLYVLLTRIERSFRYLKSTLGIRPVFHQRSERVDAHIFISLLAYHLLHAIELRLQENGDHRSWPTIRDLLATHQMVTIMRQCTDGTVLRLRRPSQPELEHRKIYRTLRIPATPPLPGRNRL